MKEVYKVGVASLGCSKNTVDTENMLGYFKSQGLEITGRAEEADILVVNTCGFIESAKLESVETIIEMSQYKKNGKCKLLVVTGCLSQRYMSDLPGELPEVDIFWGVKDYAGLVDEVMRRIGVIKPKTCEDVSRILTTPFYSAYLRIADGCSNRCTYCAIPLIRGDMKSVPEENLICETERLVKNGVTELNVIAQDTSAYGIDLYGELRLPKLLKRLADIDGVEMVRLLYTYPDSVTDELIDTIASHERIANYIDIPIQHINNELLKRMNRRGTKEDIVRIFNRLRRSSDDFIIRTSIIVGFPGETEEQFQELLDFISEYKIDRIGAFTYSKEENTPAFDFENQISDEVKEERLNRLMTLQANISLELNKKRIGEVCKMLVEDISEGYLVGRTYAEAPDVDGCVRVPVRCRYDIDEGDYVAVKITSADEYDLEGEIYEFTE